MIRHAARDLSRLFGPVASFSRGLAPSGSVPSVGVIVVGGELAKCTAAFARAASLLVLGDSGADSLRRVDATLVYACSCRRWIDLTSSCTALDAGRPVWLATLTRCRLTRCDSTRRVACACCAIRSVETLDPVSVWLTADRPLQNQDEHDFDKCVRALLDGARGEPLEALAFGALGGSVTHEFAAFNTLMRHSSHPSLRLSLASDHTFATVVPRGVSTLRVASPLRKAPFCGIIPLGAPAHDVTTTGFRWNLSALFSFAFFLVVADVTARRQVAAEL